MNEPIKLLESGASATIIFNRPEIRSPISVAVIEALESLLIGLTTKGTVERLVFTGRQGVFASGADLREIAKLTSNEAAAFARRGQSLMEKIADVQFETVAAVNGYCLGGALDLALACKSRIASRNAMFAHPGARLGIITGWGGTQRLPRLIGQAAALEMLFTAEPITADGALRIGLIGKIVDENAAEFDSPWHRHPSPQLRVLGQSES